jgi:ankyrin repeat protein
LEVPVRLQDFLIFFALLSGLVNGQGVVFEEGDRITVITTAVKVRDAAGLSSNQLGKQVNGSQGVVLSSTGIYADGYWWWLVDFDTEADGWVAQGSETETFIEKLYPSEVIISENRHPLDINNTLDIDNLIKVWQEATVTDIENWLQTGVDINARNSMGNTILMQASMFSRGEIVRALLDAGADINIRNNAGTTVLTFAASNMFVASDVLSVLVEAGCNVNTRTEDGSTALMTAAVSGNYAAISFLIQAGANLNAQDSEGVTALMFALKGLEPKVAIAFLNAGADVNLIDKSGYTALMLATQRNDISFGLVFMFTQAGADVNARDQYGRTALMFAAANHSYPESITALTQAGADVNSRTEGGLTPLMFAANSNPNPEVIVTLLKAGADATLPNSEGKKALDYAKENSALKGTDAYWQLNDASY